MDFRPGPPPMSRCATNWLRCPRPRPWSACKESTPTPTRASTAATHGACSARWNRHPAHGTDSGQNPDAPTHAGIVRQRADSPIGVFLQRDRAELHHRIAQRTDEMFRRGVLAEVAAIPLESVGATAAQMIGWRECLACVRGELAEAEAKERINAATRQYAKRQITWFKRETAFSSADAGSRRFGAEVNRADSWLDQR